MNILNEFIGEFDKKHLISVAGVGFILSPSILFLNLLYNLILPSMASADTSGIPSDVAFLTISLLLTVIVAPVFEELTYRGLMLIFIKLTKKPLIMLLISSAVFGYMHEGVFGSFQATIAGFILGCIAYKYGIGFSIITHMITNALSLFNGFLIIQLQNPMLLFLFIIELLFGIYLASDLLKGCTLWKDLF